MLKILDFWFPNNDFQKFWFDKSVDEYIKNNYYDILKTFESKILDYNILTDFQILEYIIILDQFSRNIYRNHFYKKNDYKALELSLYFFENRNWEDKQINHLIFYLMPLRHSNNKQYYKKIFNILAKKKDNSTLYTKFYKATVRNYSNLVD